MSAAYYPAARGVRWDDPAFAIAWPDAPPESFGAGPHVAGFVTARRVLVTGRAGSSGARRSRPSERGFEVHGAALDAPLLAPAGVVWHRVDLLEPGARSALRRGAADPPGAPRLGYGPRQILGRPRELPLGGGEPGDSWNRSPATGGARVVVRGDPAPNTTGPGRSHAASTPRRCAHTLCTEPARRPAVRGVIGACGPRGTLAVVGPNLPRARAARGLVPGSFPA